MEEWRQLQDYPGYEVSSEGRVRSLNGTRGNPRQEPLVLAGKTTAGNGYRAVSLGRGNTKYIHRLVGQTFIPNPENLPQIDHINRNRTDNRVCNLRWVDSSTQNRNKSWIGNTLGERYITQTVAGTYTVSLTFKTLDEAIMCRDTVLGL
jgi:hypothetical protein